MSPEALGRERASPSFDLWPLAVVFYEMLTAHKPFQTDGRDELTKAIRDGEWQPIDGHLPGCPEKLRSFFDRTLHLRSDRRPRTASELARKLESLRVC